ncbi:phage terminase large subunit family protein [Novosphingobium mangrovi (ex Huang et al. 2023)]|uniref:Phage terminase large subunit family protein n=1 Tax=Novosphingobium mangrovi (ex Huang et al. 2023) TaxID=2976432 RepID=A0ABT2I1M9_9SPHN|nr:phage terminase large subunit family protein [Novosphingobium mangrovi (ex Huang et al. 2023)]MCT2398517.1 phage terminase large subunit family protein [Novosphingobium mangrovi (ex Huang et al. 2023)]
MLELDGQHDPLAFADAGMIVAECLSEMRFPERVSVSAAARRHRVLANPGAYSGPWGEGPHFVDHLDRIMDCLGTDSPHDEVFVMGPSQTGKSEIGNNYQLHSIIYDPADMLFVMPDRTSIDSYVKTQFAKMIELARDDEGRPVLLDRMLPGSSSDTINLKRFRGGDLHFLWPSGPTFRARPIPRGRLDDLDDIPTDIGDQGDAVSLMRGRMSSFSVYGQTMLYVNSTPKLGRHAGIEGMVAAGTDERLWVDCLHCHEPFAFYVDALEFDQTGTKEDAASSAEVKCPSCGSLHGPRDKRALLQTYRWVGKGEKAVSRQAEETGKTGELIANRRASFRLDGLFGFRPWSEIAALGREADIKLEYEQDEGPLKAWNQTIVGRNHVPKTNGESPVTEDELLQRAKAAPWVVGEVPPGVQVLIAAIDQQVNRFEVGIWGFGQNFRAWLVDRFKIDAIEDAGEARTLKPFTRPEDWAAIHRYVMQKSYPISGAPHLRMKLFNTVVDTGGLDNATDNAFAWWFAMVAGDPASGRAPIPATAITLFKGGNNPKGKLLPQPTPDAKRQIKGAPQAELYIPNVNRVKDILDVRLNRRDDGPGHIAFPADLDPRYLAEMRAETKIGDQWTREPHTANETMDTYVMAYTAVLRFGASDASLGWVPEWARPPRGAPAKLQQPVPEPGAATTGQDSANRPPNRPTEPPEQPMTKIVKSVAKRPVQTRPRRKVRSSRG